MAITLMNSPATFSPAGNAVIFQVESDDANLRYFDIELLDPDTNAVMAVDRMKPRPDLQTGVVVDFSKQLSNFVDYDIYNSAVEFVHGFTKPIKSYKVKFTEKIKSGGSIVAGATLTTDVFYVFEAKLDMVSFENYDESKYVMAVDNNARFLTYKPLRNDIYQNSTEYLYFLQDGTIDNLCVNVKVYDVDGSFIDTYSVVPALLSTTKMYRVSCSPKSLKAHFDIDLTYGQYYTVCITTATGILKSEVRTFTYKEFECHFEAVNAMWTNSLGGVDCYQFINPQDTLNVARTEIKKATYKLDGGYYTNITNGVFNVSDDIINTVSSVTSRMYTRELQTDDEVRWLGQCMASKNVFIELSDENVVPVKVVNQPYEYTSYKYMKEGLNIKRFELQFPDWFIPALSNKVVSYVLTDKFYNELINYTVAKDDCGTGYAGTSVTYTVPAGTYSSIISQQAANDLAWTEILANAQDYANTNGSCTVLPAFYNVEKTKKFQKNDCGAGVAYGSVMTYTVAAGTFTSYVSQSDADAQADADIAANGQAWVNANGTCNASPTYWNTEVTMTVYKDDCPTGYTGAGIPMTVPAYTHSSGTSQHQAQMGAIGYILANGQAYANANDTCTIAVGNDYQSELIQKNDCPSGQEGTSVLYEVPADTFFSFDKADANAKALQDIDINGQAYANANGECVLDSGGGGEIHLTAVTSAVYDGIYYQYSVQIFASAPVTGIIECQMVVTDQYGVTTEPFEMPVIYNGETSSYSAYMGSYPPSTIVTISILSVSPNPDFSGTTYTF